MQGFFTGSDVNAVKFQKLFDQARSANKTNLERCKSWYDISLLSLETEWDHEWFKINYIQALKDIKNALKEDVFLGHFFQICLGLRILARMNWGFSSKEEREIANQIYDAVYPVFLPSLFVFNLMSQSKDMDFSSYPDFLADFAIFDNEVEFMTEKFKLEMQEMTPRIIQDGIECGSLSRNEVKKIEADAKEYVVNLNQSFVDYEPSAPKSP